MIELNTFYIGDSSTLLCELEDSSIDCVVTSPPYDGMRTYNGFVINIPRVANELYRVMKDGGVVVWVVGDQTIHLSETGTSFRHALEFMDHGFLLYDTMIYAKNNPPHITTGVMSSVLNICLFFRKGDRRRSILYF